jgi:hypothetical protein
MTAELHTKHTAECEFIFQFYVGCHLIDRNCIVKQLTYILHKILECFILLLFSKFQDEGFFSYPEML